MNKSIFVYPLMALLLLFSVSAALTDNLIEYWAFDDISGNSNGSIGSYNMTRQNNPVFKTVGCAKNGCYLHNGTGGAGTAYNGFKTAAITHIAAGDSVCLGYWANFSVFTTGYWMVSLDRASLYKFASQSTGGANMKLLAGGYAGVNSAFDTGLLSHYVSCFDETNNVLLSYKNGILITNQSTGATAGNDQPVLTFVNGGTGGFGTAGAGQLFDEVGLWDRILTVGEISQLAAGSSASFYPFVSATSSPTWAFPTPTDATANNTRVIINMSCAGNNNYLYFGTASTPTVLVLTNSSSGQYSTSVVSNGVYYYRGFCYNATSNIYSGNTTVRSWTFDDVIPSVVLNPSNEFNVDNVTLNNAFDKLVYLNFSLSDNVALFGYDINISKGGVIYFNETNLSLSGLNHNFTRVLDVNNWSSGVYKFDLLVADAHTEKDIGEYKVTTRANSVAFEVKNGNKIVVESAGADFVAVKKFDRYEFDVNFADKGSRDRLINVKSDKCPLYYAVNSPFRGHIVSYCNGGGNWIDFEGASGKPIVNRVNDYHYTVYFSNLKDGVTFRSIGGLNVYNVSYSFYVGNYSFNRDTSVAGELDDLWLNVSLGGSLSSISSVLNYNGGLKPVQTTVASGYNYFNSSFVAPNSTGTYNFTWNVTVNNSVSTYVFNVSSTQNINVFGFSNCSDGLSTNATLNLFYYYEQIPTYPLSSSLEILIDTWSTSRSNTRTYSFTFSPATSHSICIYPQDAVLYADVNIKYEPSVGFTERYFLINHTFNGVAQTLNLYNWNTTSLTSVLKLTTRNIVDYSYFENVVVTLQRQYVGEGVWRNVQMDESGDFGLVNFNILERTTDYRLVFVDRASERVIKTTQPIKFVCSGGVCDLTYLLNLNTSSVSSNTLSYNYSYGNTSRILSLNWSDSTGLTQSVRLFVWKNTVTGLASICDSTMVGNGGSFACNTTGYQGEAFVSLSKNSDPVAGFYMVLERGALSSLIPSREGGIWTLLIMVTCIMFGLFSPVGSIITGVLGLVFIFMLGIFSPLTVTGVTIAAIIGVVIGFKVRS